VIKGKQIRITQGGDIAQWLSLNTPLYATFPSPHVMMLSLTDDIVYYIIT